MKKELTFNTDTLTGARLRPRISLSAVLSFVAGSIEKSYPVVKLSSLYSKLLEEPVSPRRTLRFVNAQLAAFMLLCAESTSTLGIIVLAAWTVAAIYGCRKV